MTLKKKIIMILCSVLFLLPVYTRTISPIRINEFLGHFKMFPSIHSHDKNKFIINDKEIWEHYSRIAEYIEQNSYDPYEYILDKFQNSQVVVLGESHWLKAHTEFVEQLLPKLAENNITDYAVEWSNIQMQPQMNKYLASDPEDLSLLYECLAEEYDLYGWPYKGYVDIFRTCRKINLSLSKNNEQFRVHLVDAPLRNSNTQVPWRRDRCMGETLARISKDSRKILFHCGATHAILNLKNRNGSRYPTAASVLTQNSSANIFVIRLDYFGFDIHKEQPNSFANGIFLEINKKNKCKNIGFDLINSPFENIAASQLNDLIFSTSHIDDRLIDAYQGYILFDDLFNSEFCHVEKDMFYQGYVTDKIIRDNFISGWAVNILFSNEQLIQACEQYKIDCLGL